MDPRSESGMTVLLGSGMTVLLETGMAVLLGSMQSTPYLVILGHDRVSRVSVSECSCFFGARNCLGPEVYGSPIGVGDDGSTWDGNDGGAWVEDGISSLLSHTRLDRVSRVSVSECLCFCGARASSEAESIGP